MSTIMRGATHPWRVGVYVEGATKPVRVFDGYKTENDANAYADVLRSQIRANHWTHKVRVTKESGS